MSSTSTSSKPVKQSALSTAPTPWATKAIPGSVRRVKGPTANPVRPISVAKHTLAKTDDSMRRGKTVDGIEKGDRWPTDHERDSSVAQSSSSAPSSSATTSLNSSASGASALRVKKFTDALAMPNVDLENLRKLSWPGIPPEVRPTTWKLLLGYLPTNSDRRNATLERKRKEYKDGLEQYFNVGEGGRDQYEQSLFRQIHIDVPRTNPTCPLFQQDQVQRILERILYMWAIRHPASGYVQGINDLATPFFVVFLSEIYEGDPETCDLKALPQEDLDSMEADCFWCMSQLLDCIQENYTFAQPGIQRMIFKLQELVDRIDAPLAKHLEEQDAVYLSFAFRWMNCLLMREIPLRLIVRIWDTYLSEGESFASFHVYVCAAFLTQWSERIRRLEFQDMMMFLQHLPTTNWLDKDVEMLLSQAFLYQSLYQNAPSHLKPPS